MRPSLVRATLAGRKTQTRRLVTPGTSTVIGWKSASAVWPRLLLAEATTIVMRPPEGQDYQALRVPLGPGDGDGLPVIVVPRVRPGDAAYVREPWQTGNALDDEAPSMLAAWAATAGQEPCGPVRYVADDTTHDAHLLGPGSHYGEHWGRTRPGIHLPRWASRLVLPVVTVRAERVCSISEADARAEGVEPDYEKDGRVRNTSRSAFAGLWDYINGQRSGASWAANPWVWVYEWPPVGAASP